MVDDNSKDLYTLVGEWLTVPDLVEKLGQTVPVVRRLIKDREVVAVKVGEPAVQRVPAKFFDANGPVAHLRGTISVLSDARFSDEEIVEWLFTPDATLPVEGAPIDAILAGFKTEVRRRAAEMAL